MTVGDITSHTGRLFIPLPDGDALMYELKGESGEPDVESEITFDKDVRTKSGFMCSIPVSNWLKARQRFHVVTKLDSSDPSAILRGGETIDLEALETKDYRLNFLSHKPGTYKARITFTNSTTKEYMF